MYPWLAWSSLILCRPGCLRLIRFSVFSSFLLTQPLRTHLLKWKLWTNMYVWHKNPCNEWLSFLVSLCLYQVKLQVFLPCLLRSGKSHSFLLPCSCSPCSSCRQSLCPQCCRVESEVCPWVLCLPLLRSVVVLCPHSAPPKVWALTSEATLPSRCQTLGALWQGRCHVYKVWDF